MEDEEIKDRFEAEQILKKHGVLVVGKPAGELLLQSARLSILKIFSFFVQTVPLDYKNKFNDSVLHYAAKGGNTQIVNYLLQRQIVQTTNLFGETPLFYAVEEGHAPVVELLADQQALNVRDKFGDCVLHVAAREGHEDVCRLLLKKKKDWVNWSNENGQTPLAYAMESGNLTVAEVLQKSGGKMQN